MLKKFSAKMSLLVVFTMLMSVIVVTATTLNVQAAPSFELIGFATLNGGTTGGTGGTEITATSVSQVNDILSARKKSKDTTPLIIKFDRKLTGSEVIACKEVSNITFLGVGTSGELEGCGINIVKSKNIIVQNLKIHHTRAPMDAIGVENSQNIWVDHCELYNMIGDCNGDGIVNPNDGDTSGGDVDWYDGLLDVKRSSEYITVSWNYMHDSYKTSLVGSSDSDDYDRKITFHHNVYSNLKSRTPSYRGGTGHMFNNYYVNVSGSGINSRVGAKLRIEANVFENVGCGSVDSKTGFAEGPIGAYYSSNIGYWDVKDNIFVDCKGNQPTTSTCSFNPPYNYTGVLQPASQVKETVLQYAGVQGGIIPTPPTPQTTSTPQITPTQNTPQPEMVYGDINGDGLVDSTDLTIMKRYILKRLDFTSDQLKAADVNLDNEENSTDITILKRFILKKIRTLPYTNGTQPTSIPTTSQPTTPPNTGDGIVHEAEAGSNNLKYAKIESNYVVFDQTKDAYVEMKKVSSSASGEVTLTFVYSNGSGKSLPMEIKVNGNTIESNKEFPSTGSWNTWNTLSVKANMDSGSDNIIRFKTRSSDGGPQLDKVIVGTNGSVIIPTPTSPTSTPTSYTSQPTTPPPTSTPIDGDIILEPNGSMDLQQAINAIKPGQTIYLKGGNYKFSKTVIIAEGNNGTSSAMKRIFAYGSDKPVIDFSAMSENSSNRGVVLAANYWHIKGVTIKGAGDNGMLLAGSNNKIEACTFTENHDSGLQLSRYNTSYKSIDQWPSNNLIVDCISTLNFDSGREDADGFAPKLTCGKGNVFRNCKALYNCDDGWDMYTKSDTGPIGIITLENCEAIGNGYDTSGKKTGGDGNGYKLGDDTAPVAHILKNCVAEDNAKHGFTGNGNPARIVLENCTGSGNAQKLFDRLNNAIFK
jgi:pectate lyase